MREVHGVATSDRVAVLLREADKTRIFIETPGYNGAYLSAQEARHLARQLNRMARRIEYGEVP